MIHFFKNKKLLISAFFIGIILSLFVKEFLLVNDPRGLFSDSPLSFIKIPPRKSEKMLSLLLERYRSEGIEFKSDAEFYSYYLENKDKIGKELSLFSQNYKTLFSNSYEGLDNKRLNYYIRLVNDKIKVVEDTNVSYYHTDPHVKIKSPIDFEVLISSNFGLSCFYYSNSGILKNKFRMNKPYYSAISTREFLILGGSAQPIEIISRKDNQKIFTISGFYVKALFQDKNKIYVIASEESNPDKTSIYLLTPTLGTLEKITPPVFGDARGGTAIDHIFVVADGNKHRIAVWDNKEKKITKVVEGFNYPNDITLTPRKTFLVANEHNNEVLEIDFRSEKILRSSPMGELRSPGSALEIDRGRYKGYWLISDTDNDRVILVHPETWEIVFECNNLNGPLSAVPIFE